jgi:hypothetical protein
MESKQISSFIVRFQVTDFNEESNEKQWRIKVTHVQEDNENLFNTIEDAMQFMKMRLEDS